MDIKTTEPVVNTTFQEKAGDFQQNVPEKNFPDVPESGINFQKDTFEVETPDVKEIQNDDAVEVDFTRTLSSEVDLEIQNHLEKAVKEVARATTTREQEREGVLEAEKKIRYKILEQGQPQGPYKDGIPIVKPKRVIVRRKKEINPARRLPKYLPTVDGEMWKVWGYPEFIELSTSSSEEVVEIPEGVELDQDGYPLLDPDTFDFSQVTPKWLRVLGRVVLYSLQSLSGFFMVKYGVKLWHSINRDAYLKHEKRPPDLDEETDSNSEREWDF